MAELPSSYGVVWVTTASAEEAKRIAASLVTENLAACANIYEIRSIYTWKGAVQDDGEWQLTIKTHLSLFDRLEARIRQLHSYEEPEIIALPIVAGSPSYLDWIGQSVGR